MRDSGSLVRILDDREFESSRKVLEAKRKELRRQGKGRRVNAAQPLSTGEEGKLWETGMLGCGNPTVLLHTIWYICTVHFGLRGVDEHRRMCYSDFELSLDDNGTEFVELKVERGTKTRTGCEYQQERAFNPRMYAIGGDQCPVKLFKKYISLCPQHTKYSNSPFYIQPAVKINDMIWYKNQPVGINSLGKYMKIMSDGADICKKTNHSARKTMITKLMQNDIHPNHVAQLSGHKNLKSLDYYSKASDVQQKKMSNLISGASSAPSNVTNSGNNVVNVFYNQIPTQSNNQIASRKRKRPDDE